MICSTNTLKGSWMEWDVMDVSSSGWGGRPEREEARGAESDNIAEWG